MSVRLNGISKLYGSQRALDKISFSIDSGQIVGILGPNGAGKSTMMKIITGFLHQDEGEIWVNEIANAGNTLEGRKQIGYLPENNPLYTDLYIKEYLEFVGGIYHLSNLKNRIADIIELTGLSKEKHKKIGALSKGYRQRVGIAQALIHDPSVLILDEPTSGLDPSQIVEIRQLIKNISSNKTVLLSTHIMQEAEAICDRIIIINNGKIIADDTAAGIKTISSEDSHPILVEFLQKVSTDQLNSIQGIKEVKSITDSKYLIYSNTDLRPAIFDFSVKNGFTILTMMKQESSLERAFLDMIK
jgi:ABC-2 type transport system ATP-binding protein